MKTPFNTPMSGSVLVADDEDFNRQLLRDPLQAQGYTVLEAECGNDALHIAQGKRIDVILLDVMMPNMDGFQVCRRLKEDPGTASIPIIMVTALSERKERIRCIECGANDFLTKPIDLTDVLLRVRNAVQSSHLYHELQKSFERRQELEAIRDKLFQMLFRELRFPVQSVHERLERLRNQTGIQLPQWWQTELQEICSAIMEIDKKLSAVGTPPRQGSQASV